MLNFMEAEVVSVSRSPTHGFSKQVAEEISIVAGFGVEGDAHAGVTVRHRYRVKQDPTALNLCQVHLLPSELFDELGGKGLEVSAGAMGENVTTRGLDVAALGVGTRLHLGESAVVEVTGLREPCGQLNDLQPGLMKACLARDADGRVMRKAGIMGIAVESGVVRAGDRIRVEVPEGAHRPMGTV